MAFNLADVLKNVSDSDTNREQIEYISLNLIDEDPNNFYQLSEIPLLADNISLCGLQQPIRVRQKEDGRYIIVSGHRRRAALEMLVADGYAQWKDAPCIVERDSVSPALQQLRLIYANASTRKMSNAEIGEQAEQVRQLLYQLKEEGYEFPGRMADHVSEAVGQSKSKLARLKVIRENLDAVWMDAWKGDLIGESVAYALSQMPKSWQAIIHKVWGDNTGRLYADTVERLKKTFRNLAEVHCQHGLTLCEHAIYMMEKSCRDTQKNFYAPHCTTCCFECNSLQTCKSCCPQALSKQKKMKATAKKAEFDAERKQEEKDRPGAEFAQVVFKRIGEARRENGISVKNLFEAQKRFYSESIDDPKQEKMESGMGEYSPSTHLPFGVNVRAADAMKMVAVADALHCSIDYLLGRTERMELVSDSDTKPEAKEVVSYSDATWQTDDPDEVGDYLLIIKDPYEEAPKYERGHWDGKEWRGEYGLFYPDIDGEVKGWIPMPKVPDTKIEPANNESCITGMSPSGHCGAAAYCSNEYTCCLQCPDESCNGRCGWPDVEENSEMISSAVEVIRETGVASVSMLQRKLKLGYSAASSLMDDLEKKGYVGPYNGSSPREILITKDGSGK